MQATFLREIKRTFTAADSAIRLFLAIAFTIFFGDIAVMLVLPMLPPMSVFGDALFDSSVLLILVFPVLYLTVFRPLTSASERTRAEAQLRKRQADLEEAQRIGQIGSWDWNSTTDTITWSNELKRIFGLDPKQSPPAYEGNLKLYTPESAARLDEAVKSTAQTGRPYVLDLEHVDADGTKRWIRAHGEAKRDAHGQFVGLRGTAQDITQRKRAEAKLVESEARFRGLVEQSLAGIYIVQDGKFAYVNPRYAEIFGYGSAGELTGRDFLPMVTEKDRNRVDENIRQRVDGEVESIGYEFTGVCKDGSIVEVGVHGSRAIYDGRPAVIGLIQDISEKKRAKEDLQQYVEQLKMTLLGTVDVATTLGEMRDPYTADHQRRVAKIAVAVAIGKELGFDANRQEGLRIAGHLHDIGKITIPSEILSKPGKLTAIEFMLIKGHAQASYDVLKSVKFPWPVAQVALQHHERTDGSGYPQGLKGEEILLESRIIAVADVVEAMASHRPYRPGLGIEKALAEIERGSGTAYDPHVADACLRLFREKDFQLPA
jgi:PAS domain S-box-containing protein